MSGLKLPPARITAAKPSATTAPDDAKRNWLLDALTKDIQLSSPRLSDKQKEAVYLELGLLLGAGVDVKAALDLQVQQYTGAVQTTLSEIRAQVLAGSSISAAVQASGKFTPYEYFSLQIGEESGRLVSILQELASYYTRKIKQRRQITQALAYPVVVMTTALGAVLFMLNFIVPMFSDVFRRFGGKLPQLTQLIVELSVFVREHWPQGAVLFAILLAANFRLRKTPAYQRLAGNAVLRMPIVGPIVRRVYLARLCSSLALLSGAHIPLLQALELARQMLGFPPIATALQTVEHNVMQGAALHTSLQAFSIFDARMIALLKVGEEVNKLDYFFGVLAQQYTEEVEHRTSLLSTTLEPLIIIFLGLVVGTILIAMYLPIFQMSSAIG